VLVVEEAVVAVVVVAVGNANNEGHCEDLLDADCWCPFLIQVTEAICGR